LPTFLVGNIHLDAEKLIAYEMGYRVVPSSTLSFDFVLFYDDYHDLQQVAAGSDVPALDGSDGLNRTFVFTNDGEAELYGGAALANWSVTDAWRLQAWYNYIRSPHPFTTDDPRALSVVRTTPANKAVLRSLFDLTPTVQLDGYLRFVDNMPGQPVPSYLELNLRLGWKIRPNLDLSIIGTDLLDNQHVEAASSPFDRAPSKIERGVYGKLTWMF
jgi:iron complex outermembrane receptor protein